ncbi:uncharacterized protein NECHADRAFT_74786 [Fusarium vanettenii 77-13-4]|uniref:DUF7603 domain-containing protein n=1 Tax=Fusarium vanettenii (strain ATCC MYA-4622 / CBS 123669 / FGSC 9596 / NRRL 45880 / 77-13-4) TaxID=660122 RepID=C7YGY7_FUSV7|nr:uncharacterized protein NECHADRAFT_74786 [Fusarium vanettenii 77-13-4]EEU48541.1 hypothetical protein NECHADRAFT_74786 [Fusarium vanettenii 77-13-4]
MEPALAAAPAPAAVPMPSSSTSNSDTRPDTTAPPVDVPSASASADPDDISRRSSSTSDHPLRTLPEASPRNAAAHSRSQTVDYSSSASGPAAPESASVTSPTGPPIKRKPLSSSASALALRFSSSGSPIPSPLQLPKPDQRFARPDSVDSPTLYEFSPAARASPQAGQPSDKSLATLSATPAGSQNIPGHSPTASHSDFSDVLDGYDDLISDFKSDSAPDVTPETVLDESDTDDDTSDEEAEIAKVATVAKVTKVDSSDKETVVGPSAVRAVDHVDETDVKVKETGSIASETPKSISAPAPMFAPKPTPPHLKLDKVAIDVANYDTPPDGAQTPPSVQTTPSPQLNKPLPKSPGQTSPFAALFSWAAPSPSATEFSSISSPISPGRNGGANDTPYSTSSTSAQIDEMEEELKAISVELASSIRREMDLEDLVDRLQDQINNSQTPGKRTSDYYSDSGYSSAKTSDSELSRDELDKVHRRAEQEKASIRLELTNKLQDERGRRKALDQQIKELAERASQVDLAQMNNMDASGRLKDLETTCGDLRRRLSEERTVKNNFEDLINAIRGELHEACSERDNLRDEIVPQLRSRVEGLEAEAAEYSNLTYESSKMQQELQMLKRENDTLRQGSKSGTSTPPLNRMSRAMSGGMSGGLARSNSVATSSFRGQRPSGLSRSNSVKNTQLESREALAERLKDVEAQRDALHSALKSLLERQEFQNRENEKKIRILQHERERLMSTSPRKAGFEREISNLRTEINVLRRRAEDALEQKYQVENGLGGLKMDLDRAEEEIALLRDLLKEKDILIPESFARASGSSTSSGSFASPNGPVTSESLEKAYKELQAAYADSLERIKQLEHDTANDDKTQLAMERLERTLSIAVSERDAAKHEVDALKNQYDELSVSESKTLESERALADDLNESARRVEELASQVRHQLSSNAQLRERLANAVTRGENDRKSNSDRIADLQVRLRTMEEQLIAAQTASEDRVNRHEEEITAIREAHNAHLQRMSSPTRGGLRSPSFQSGRKPSLLSPLSARFPGPVSPRLTDKSFEDAAQMEVLRERVSELEKALEDAEHEMQDVVARMNTAQIEVLNLQDEREAAVRETRKLQKLLEQEQMKSFEERFKTLSG